MSMDSIAGSQLLATLSQSSSPRLDSDQMSIKSEDDTVSKVKLMCSYGGRIMMRPHDSQLRYIGGDTRILVVSRTLSYADLCHKLSRICGGRSVYPKYKLPYEDYDALVSVICDDDLEAMMEEYDRLDAGEAPSKLRLFLFPKTKPSGPSHSFDSTNSEQSFLEALNGTLDQPQQGAERDGTDFLFGLESLGSQEVIIDRPGGASASSSGSSVVQHMIEADSALQSELPPIYTSQPRLSTPPPPVQLQQTSFQVSETQMTTILPGPVSLSPFVVPSEMDSIYVPQQARIPQISNLAPSLPVPPVSMQHILTSVPVSQPQVLPPKGPKPKSSPQPDGSKEKKDKTKLEPPGSSLSPKTGGGKSPTEAAPGIPTTMDMVVDGMESLRLGEPPNRWSNSSPVEKSEEPKVVEGDRLISSLPEIPVKQGSAESLKEMSLNVFMEQQHKEEAREKIGMSSPPAQSFANVEHHANQQQQTFVQPQVQYYHQQPQQPYIIENNMVYFLADATPLQPQASPQVQYIQPQAHVNPVTMQPMQFQRGGSGPLMTRQQVVAPLQRQVSAAYVEQQQKQQQQLHQRVVYPVSRTGPGAQSPSRFREPVSQIPVQVQQFEGLPQLQMIRPQQVPLVRAQQYETDPMQQMPFTGTPTTQQMPYTGTPSTQQMPYTGTPTTQQMPYGTPTAQQMPFTGTPTTQQKPFTGTPPSQQMPFPGTP